MFDLLASVYYCPACYYVLDLDELAGGHLPYECPDCGELARWRVADELYQDGLHQTGTDTDKEGEPE